MRLKTIAEYLIALLITLVCLSSATDAQKKRKKPAPASQPTLAQKAAKAKEDLIKAANDYKASLAILLKLQEEDVKSKAEMVEKRKALLDQQIISKREVEEGERQLAAAQAKVTETRKQMAESDDLIAEAKAAEQLAKLP